MVLRLSDLFEADPEGRRPALEVRATVMLNINYGHNRALMEKCRRLKGSGRQSRGHSPENLNGHSPQGGSFRGSGYVH